MTKEFGGFGSKRMNNSTTGEGRASRPMTFRTSSREASVRPIKLFEQIGGCRRPISLKPGRSPHRSERRLLPLAKELFALLARWQ